MAERVGFEPTSPVFPATRFRGELFQPLRHLSAVVASYSLTNVARGHNLRAGGSVHAEKSKAPARFALRIQGAAPKGGRFKFDGFSAKAKEPLRDRRQTLGATANPGISAAFNPFQKLRRGIFPSRSTCSTPGAPGGSAFNAARSRASVARGLPFSA